MRLPSLLFTLLLLPLSGQAEEPGRSLDCHNKVYPPTSNAGKICSDPELSRLDRMLAWNYRRAVGRTSYYSAIDLRRSQEDWEKSRNRCWYTQTRRTCLRDSYRRRIAGLQARYALIASEEPRLYHCDDLKRSSISLRFFPTDPPTLTLRAEGEDYLLFSSPTPRGLQYEGEGSKVREGVGGLLVDWPELPRTAGCVLQPAPTVLQ